MLSLCTTLAACALMGWGGPREDLWSAAKQAPAGPERVQALLLAMEEDPIGGDRERLLFAWQVGVDEGRALRLEQGALPVQQRLHALQQAPWSAMDLAVTLTWMGRLEAADSLLAEQIERSTLAGDPAAVGELWSRRGIIAQGEGNVRRARNYFGRALIHSNRNAALILARMDLDAGRSGSAGRVFRALMTTANPDAGPPEAWTLRGWGLSMLPRR